MSARSDIVYGRRGGRWADQAPGEATAFFAQLRAEREAEAEAVAAELERTGEQLDLFG